MSSPLHRRWTIFACSAFLILTWTGRSVADESADERAEPSFGTSHAIYVAQPATPSPNAETQPAPAQPAPAQPRTSPPAGTPTAPSRGSAAASEPAPSPNLRPDVRTLAARTPVLRLASVPNMLGDFFNQGGQFSTTGGNVEGTADLPAAGGGRRFKIAENNKALPMNRCYLMYHHFHNALAASTNAPPTDEEFSVNRYTIGMERMFWDNQWSVDVRMPFYERYESHTAGLDVQGGEIGNLCLCLKRLVFSNSCSAVAAGMGIEVPTGSDVQVSDENTDFTLQNQAVHLSPYVGFLRSPTERTFLHGFLQLDVPLGGNEVQYAPSQTLGVVDEQVLMLVDLSAGYWLYQNPCADLWTGLATLAEVHYATTLQDADILTGSVNNTTVRFGNLLNQVDITNLTVGLHAEFRRRTTLRVSGVFPLQDEPDRPFDAELHVTLNHYY